MRNRIKELRARYNINQTQLAQKAMVSRQTISLIERNELIPSLLTAVKISKVFDQSIEEVFLFEEEELY
ncbi:MULTISPECIES: helix-turn-helix transcriptional regulator [Bacillus cereus group]|uniref:CerR2 protein n=1 Tax=Bacillus cereus VPC1401 TaxID=870739 RepID=E5AK69_BACCE|nr:MULTISPECIES: helix-turn-helix transcriptional regulator [Bacillus cereus group]AKR13169.1 XRE family transcriptional regulator [Bacillus thuringiensis]MDZ4588753.1 helix-turn-helix transcriptional regulator [Bacillus cereus]MDZ4599600.1 helix-turn-helix transcriptional regulator [Bacillus cereus]MED2800982.1 helix-turn-helix transcriptional regulator [Bacillus thuringiensis]WPA86289.1 helix-turn-helix transcriptional regulator [Bacillus cereus]